MTNDQSLRALRFAATLCDVVPSIRIRLRTHERVVLREQRDADKTTDIDGPICHPDSFRSSIAHAYKCHVLGDVPGLFEAVGTYEPAIDIGLIAGDRALPGGIFRIAMGQQHLHIFTTTLSPSQCQAALERSLGEEFSEETSPPNLNEQWRKVGLHYDALTDVTAVHAFAHEDDFACAYAAMAKMLEVLVATEVLIDMGIEVLEDVVQKHL